RPEDFYDDANRTIFEHFLSIVSLSRQIDMALLVERLRTAGDYEKIGGAAYLAGTARSRATAANALHYPQLCRHIALPRGLINSSTGILRDAYEDGSNPREQRNRAEQKIFSILSEGQTTTVVTAHDLIHEAMVRIEQREKGERTVAGVDTGFPGIDELTGGLHNGELAIIAARPSMGKTAFALNLAEFAATELKV